MTSRIEVFYTSILANPKVRSNTEKVERFLYKVPHTKYDIASDDAAKTMWKRKNGGSMELPFILVDGVNPGTVEQLEEAVEFGELRQFLRLDEAPAPSLQDDDLALADLSKEDIDKLAAELDMSEQDKTKQALNPNSDGVETGPEDAPVPEALLKDPGHAEAEEFETGMA